eukprot:5068625-Prymnesium_polylepis.1
MNRRMPAAPAASAHTVLFIQPPPRSRECQGGRWPIMSPGGGVGRYAALRCLRHEIRVDERTNR